MDNKLKDENTIRVGSRIKKPTKKSTGVSLEQSLNVALSQGDEFYVTRIDGNRCHISNDKNYTWGDEYLLSDLELYEEIKPNMLIRVGSIVKIPTKKSIGKSLEDFYEELRDNSFYERHLVVERINGSEYVLDYPEGYKEGLVHNTFLLSDLELYNDTSVRPIIINPTSKSKLPEFTVEGIEYSEIDNNLFSLFNNDLDFYCEIENLIKYLASTYSEKYEVADSNIKSKDILLSAEGKSANIFTASKYIQRYNTKGMDKSENIKDLYKSIHYILFELQRRTKNAE